jgi:protein SCO1/2
MAVFWRVNLLPDMKMKTAIALAALLLLAACGRGVPEVEKGQIYQAKGIVRGFSPEHDEVEIEHETIPDFMPSMTMPFRPRVAGDIRDLKLGDAVAFRLTVTAKDFWIDQLKKVAREDVHVAEPKRPAGTPRPSEVARLREGDEMPIFSLTNQDGKPVNLDKFRGHPLVLTFVFTRCPVPNFCPRMSSNFAELQAAIKGGNGSLSATHLLSITLDPAFDKADILKMYGEHLAFDSSVWTFATGEPKEIDSLTEAFSVYRQTEGGTLSHGLATALVDGQGTIRKIWRGNAWMPGEVVEELKKLN